VCRSKHVKQLIKQWNDKFYYTVASCWLFLYDLYYDARIHEHQASAGFGSKHFHINLQVKFFFNNLNELSQSRGEGFALVALMFTMPNHQDS
jgi:hypothetical protein